MMEVRRSPLILSAKPPKKHLWRANLPQVRESFRDSMKKKGRELQEELEVEPVPVGMAFHLWISIQAEVSPEELQATLGEEGIIAVEEQNSGDEVWDLLADFESEQSIVEVLQVEEVKQQFLSALAAEGDDFQERYLIEYKALTPVDIGFILKKWRFTHCSPPEVNNEQTA